jgi:hypothetical protein
VTALYHSSQRSQTGEKLSDLWHRYGTWLIHNGLYYYPKNQQILNNGTPIINDDRLEIAVYDRAKEISRLVALTELPSSEPPQ